MRKFFDYKDVNLVPKKGIVESRSECDTVVEFGKNKFMLPVYPANMEAIVDIDVCETLAENQYFYTMHRFGVDQIEFVKYFKSKNLITSISIGVNQDSYELLINLRDQDLVPDYITIDIAHGHCEKMRRMLWFIKNTILIDSYIIAGNICTVDAASDLYNWGADAVKVGIAPGGACTTYMETKMGSRGIQASVVHEIAIFRNGNHGDKGIVADGGIRERGDIAVALTLGADMVMAGSLFAGLLDSPGEIIEDGDKEYKLYWGSASSTQSGKLNRIEGNEHLIELKDKTILDEMVLIQEALQSAISYAGGNDLNAFNGIEFNVKHWS